MRNEAAALERFDRTSRQQEKALREKRKKQRAEYVRYLRTTKIKKPTHSPSISMHEAVGIAASNKHSDTFATLSAHEVDGYWRIRIGNRIFGVSASARRVTEILEIGIPK